MLPKLFPDKRMIWKYYWFVLFSSIFLIPQTYKDWIKKERKKLQTSFNECKI